MWINSLVLTSSPPRITGGRPDMHVGHTLEGGLVVGGYPRDIGFGAYVEVALETGEEGRFTVSCELFPLDPSTLPELPIGLVPLVVPQPARGWDLLRVRRFGFGARLVGVDDDVDFELNVEVRDENGDIVADSYRDLIVRAL